MPAWKPLPRIVTKVPPEEGAEDGEVPIEQEEVMFGQYGPKGKNRPDGRAATWGWVLSSKQGRGYLKHFVLTDQCATVSDGDKARLAKALEAFEDEEDHGPRDQPESVEAPEDGDRETPEQEEAEADQGDAISALWAACQDVAADLVKLDELTPKEADAIDDLAGAGDLAGLQDLHDKLSGRRKRLLDAGAQPDLGF